MARVEYQNVSKHFPDGTLALDNIDLSIEDGELMVLVGPSGCGKSTALRLLAGLESPSSGHVRIDGDSLEGVEPQRRNVAMVFQNYALYPHMSVRGNLAFPLKMMKLSRKEIRRRVQEAARLLELDACLERKPAELSGGQRQRVAMGRAIVREPRVFLMDEPLSNLDARLRVQIRAEIAALQRRSATTMLYVTHDQVEAMSLGDRVAVMRAGRIQQIATPRQLYQRPANSFVATFVGSPGMDLFPVRLQRDHGKLQLRLGAHTLVVPETGRADPERLAAHGDAPLVAGLRPEAFRLSPDRGGLAATLADVENLGHEQLAYFSAPWTDGRTLVARLYDTGLGAGDVVNLDIDAAQLYFFTAEGEAIY